MYKLVVLFAAVAAASAAPTGLSVVSPALPAPAVHAYQTYAAPAIQTYTAPAIQTYAAPAIQTYTAPAVHTYAAAPVAAAVEPPTVLETRTSVGYAQAAALHKQVHYIAQPVVTGYSSSIVKPDLGSLATPPHSVVQQPVLVAGRAVQTITPQVTHVQPEVHVKKVAVDVPVHTPYVSQVEVHTPQIVAKTAPVIATPAVAATPVVAAAPAVTTYVAAAPAIPTYAAGFPAVHSYGYASGYASASAPALYKW